MVIDTLITKYKLDDSDYSRGAHNVVKLTGDVQKGVLATINPVAMMGAAFAASAVVAATAITSITVGLLSLSKAAVIEFAQFDALESSLKAVEGSADAAAEAMKRLQEIAKLPGLGLQEAIKGFSGLRLAGLNQSQSERLLLQFGNANALSGGGMEEFSRLLLALKQIVNRPFIMGEELNQLSEAGVPAHKILRDRFGTADGGELKAMGVTSGMALEAITQALEKMPRAGDNAKNAIENMQMAWSLALSKIGSGITEKLMPHVKVAIDAFDKVASSGTFEIVGQHLADMVSALNPFASAGASPVAQFNLFIAATMTAADSISVLSKGLIEIAKSPLIQLAVAALVGSNPIGMIIGMIFAQQQFNPAKQFEKNLNEIVTQQKKSRAQQFLDDLVNKSKGASNESASLEDVGKAASSVVNRQTGHLSAIERNTREMVETQRIILGGGNARAFDITPADISDMRQGSPERKIIEGMREIVMRDYMKLSRLKNSGAF